MKFNIIKIALLSVFTFATIVSPSSGIVSRDLSRSSSSESVGTARNIRISGVNIDIDNVLLIT